MIQIFYAVTGSTIETSIYRVSCLPRETRGMVFAKKIVLRGECDRGIGFILECDRLVISRSLVPYDYMESDSSLHDSIKDEPLKYWPHGTSSIIALFHDLKTAASCHLVDDCQPADSRWHEETLAVIQAIGDRHEKFYLLRGQLPLSRGSAHIFKPATAK